jgi:hypothetical protein
LPTVHHQPDRVGINKKYYIKICIHARCHIDYLYLLLYSPILKEILNYKILPLPTAHHQNPIVLKFAMMHVSTKILKEILSYIIL